MVISWDGVDDTSGYQVQWRTLTELVPMTTVIRRDDNNVTLTSLLANTQYAVTVSSLNVDGVVELTSPEVLFVTDLSSSTSPTYTEDPMDHMSSTDLMDQVSSTDPMVTCNGELSTVSLVTMKV